MTRPSDRSDAPKRLISRRQFVWTAATAASLVLSGSGFWRPTGLGAQSGGVMPKALPGGTSTPWGAFIHHYAPKPGGDLATLEDPSQITDFDGWVCDSRIFGMGMGTDMKNRGTTRYPFMADMGFMNGAYVGEDGQKHTGLFGFI